MNIKRVMVVSSVLILMANVSYAQDKLEPFPLDVYVLDLFSVGMDFKIFTSCIVKGSDQSGYDYEIKLEYTSDKRRLVSWDFVDFIFSQFPNALTEPEYAAANLFPLNVASDSYIFSFSSEYSPLRYKSNVRVFNLEDSKRIDRNKTGRVKFSDVTVNSYDFFSTELGLWNTACLPSNLKVFVE